MKPMTIDRRAWMLGLAASLLAGCAVVPKGPRPAPAPAPSPLPTPTSTLPQDQARHRVALLVPLSGSNAAVGQALANAANMALLDTNAANLRLTTYDTAKSASEAARQAVADGNALILGPLLASQVPAVAAEAKRSGAGVVSFSNDRAAATAGAFVIGHLPEQSLARSVAYTRSRGARRFAILSPGGEYGARAEAALRDAAARNSAEVVATERYDRSNTSIISAAQRLKAKGGIDAVVIAEGPRLAEQAARVFAAQGAASVRLIGTELWSGDAAVAKAPALRGAIFSAVSDDRYRQFTTSYETRFGSQPYRVATLGYDGVLMALKLAREWKPGRPFPASRLRQGETFLGLDGAFRFDSAGAVVRAMEVREVGAGTIRVVDRAPTTP